MTATHERIVRDFPEVRRVPTKYATAIGRVVTRWAYLEWLLTRIVYDLLGIGPKQGRIAVQEPRADGYIAMFNDLMKVQKITVATDLKALMTDLKAAERDRNLFAHGLWLKHPDTNKMHGVWLTRGSWKPDPHDQPINRRIRPEAVKQTPADVIAAYRRIDGVIKRTRTLQREISRAIARNRRDAAK